MLNSVPWSADPRWTIMGLDSEDALVAKFALPKPCTGVPLELVARFARIERCLRLSFVEYELVDVVADYAVVTVELALALRYKLSRGELPTRQMSLLKLMRWAEAEGLLNGVEKKAHFLRTYRNHNVHPQCDSFGGIAIAAVPRFAFEVVNGLYERQSSQ